MIKRIFYRHFYIDYSYLYKILLVASPISAIDLALLFLEHFFIITDANPDVTADNKHKKIHIIN